MADVSVDRADVARVANLLTTNSASIVDDLQGLLTAVNALLADPAGGLWLQKASPVLSASYTEFSGMLKDAIKNIDSFATSFQSVADNLDQMDTQLAAPPSS
jgi:hypothetical protein